MSDDACPPPVGSLLGRDYWLVRAHPTPSCTTERLGEVLAEHIAWMLSLEQRGCLLLSGPLLEGPGISAGAGVTVVRAEDRDEAARLVAGDPLTRAGLRTTEIFRWRVNEGSVTVTLGLGAGAIAWR